MEHYIAKTNTMKRIFKQNHSETPMQVSHLLALPTTQAKKFALVAQ